MPRHHTYSGLVTGRSIGAPYLSEQIERHALLNAIHGGHQLFAESIHFV